MEAADRYLEQEDFSPEEMDRLVEEALGTDAPEAMRADAPEAMRRDAPNPLGPEELDRVWERIRQRAQRDRLYRRYRTMKVACVLLAVLFLASQWKPMLLLGQRAAESMGIAWGEEESLEFQEYSFELKTPRNFPEVDETGTASRSFSSWEEAEEYLGLTFRRLKDMEERLVYLDSVYPALCRLSASATDDRLISGYEVYFLRKPIRFEVHLNADQMEMAEIRGLELAVYEDTEAGRYVASFCEDGMVYMIWSWNQGTREEFLEAVEALL